MRVALPILRNRISPLFDTSKNLKIVEVYSQSPWSVYEISMQANSHYERAAFLSQHAVDILICGAVSKRLIDVITDEGIEVISGVTGKDEDVLKAFLSHSVFDKKFALPGYHRISRLKSRAKHGQPKFHNENIGNLYGSQVKMRMNDKKHSDLHANRDRTTLEHKK